MNRSTSVRRALTTAALSAALFAASPSLAGDDDPETRFHRAYEAEVVDGKLADAARTYLAILRDESAPPRLRAEAKYRFAVTSVLLGRADEARAHLEELIADAATPDALRSRARASLESAQGIALGTELDRKLQSLVFDLGRVDESQAGVPPVYRDFEILGASAVPLLRKLQSHRDAALRKHAFRILVRLDEPGLAATWTPQFSSWGGSSDWRDFREYLARRTDERDAFEARLLDLPVADRMNFVRSGNNPIPPWNMTPACATALRSSLGPDAWSALARGVVVAARSSPDLVALRNTWLLDAAPEVRETVVIPMMSLLNADEIAAMTSADAAKLLRAAYEACIANPAKSPAPYTQAPNQGQTWYGVLWGLASKMSAAQLLDAFEAITAGDGPFTASGAMYLGLVAGAIEQAKPTADEAARFADLVERIVVAALSRQGLQSDVQDSIWRRLNTALRLAPEDRAVRLAASVFANPDSGRFAASIPTATARDAAVHLAALRAAPTSVQAALLDALGMNLGSSPRDATWCDTIGRALPELLRAVQANPSRTSGLHSVAQWCIAASPPESAQRCLVEFLRAARPMEDGRSARFAVRVFTPLAMPGVSDTSFVADVVLPVAEDLWSILAPDDRPALVDALVRLAISRGPAAGQGAARAMAFADAASQDAIQKMLAMPAVFPPERWVRSADAKRLRSVPRQPAAEDDARAALARIAPAAGDITPSVVAWAQRTAPDAVVRELIERALVEGPLESAPELLRAESARSLSDAALDRALERALATDAPPSGALRAVVAAILSSRVPERLTEAARRLLASQDPQDVRPGIGLAGRLGRDEFLPQLGALLASPDNAVRDEVAKAIEAIRAARALRDEAAGAGTK